MSEKSLLCCDHSSAFIFDWIFHILTGNKDNYKVSDEFEIRPDPTMDCRLAALDCLNKSFTCLRTIQNVLMTCWLSIERLLPFGLLVFDEILFLLVNLILMNCGRYDKCLQDEEPVSFC